MIKNFLMRQMMRSQLKNVPQAEKDMILDLVEKNPEFFEKLALELQEGLKSGLDQQTVAMEIMKKHQSEIANMVKK